MKSSLRAKMVGVLFGVILTFVISSILLNSLLLKPFYTRMKEESLDESYHKILSMDFGSTDLHTQLRELEVRRNMQILILNDDLSVFFCSSDEHDPLKNFMISGRQAKQWLRDWLGVEGPGGGAQPYSISGEGFNTSTNSSYLSLYAHTPKTLNGAEREFFIIINTPVVAIEDGTAAANRFALQMGGALLLIGGMITFVIGTKFVEPILRASHAADQVAHLNFDVKLPIESCDEVGMLSRSINNLSDQLRTKIDELSVTNEQLKQELAHKQRVDDMRREFISDVSHELKTPLSIILGYCEGLQMNVNSEEREYYCSVIEDEALRMSKLAARLLQLAELESGEVDPEMSDFDLGEMVTDRLTKLEYLLEERGVSIKLDIKENIPVFGDSERIEEVVNNLLTNARNHTPDGGCITATVEGNDARTVICRIHNTGSHIPEESIDRIWESFYKVDKARTRSYGGSGLGLKIVSTILQAHDSLYGARNTDDGVEFFFTMKRSNPLPEPEPEPKASDIEAPLNGGTPQPYVDGTFVGEAENYTPPAKRVRASSPQPYVDGTFVSDEVGCGFDKAIPDAADDISSEQTHNTQNGE